MKSLIRTYLSRECDKHVRRHFDYLRKLQEDTQRKTKRLGTPVKKEVLVPPYWTLDHRFNPFKVRTPKQLEKYSYSLSRAVKEKRYRPATAVRHLVQKHNGTFREVNVFQLLDAALSTLIYKSLLQKNLSRFSAYAYAYREERGSHDAVYHMFSEWKNLDRIYVAEFDFAKFFDNISHRHIKYILNKYGFLVTDEEKFVIDAFLSSDSSPSSNYDSKIGTKRQKGIPQGTSISLFLANLACWELDQALERLGVGFCRYADDTVIWSESYHKVVESYEIIRRYGLTMGVPINLDKSEGITLVTRGRGGEISSKTSVNYVGYRISLSVLSFSEFGLKKIKKRISYLIYQNLLQPLHKGNFNKARLNLIDWDYLVALSQIRRYLYGGLTDTKLRRYLRGQIPNLNFRGLMSYYPLVNDSKQLALLDGWLIHTMKQALRRRERLWIANHGMTLPGPKANWIEDLTTLRSWKDAAGIAYDFRVPSFDLINRAMQVGIKRTGITGVTHPLAQYY